MLAFTADNREISLYGDGVRLSNVVQTVVDAATFALEFRYQQESGSYDPQTTTSMYWSSGLLNFGDWIGPQLVHAMTGKQPLQGNRIGISDRRILYSVGSILGWFQRNNVDVWGSGLIKPLTTQEVEKKKKLTGIKIHAVRGKKTQAEVIDKLGWGVPDVYGDPGLLLPDFIPHAPNTVRGTLVVPHYVHRSALLDELDPSVTVVNVHEDVKTVAQTISSGEVVVSSSLHGLITAQAYGIPWVWLNVTDQPLTGRDYKFEDFFSCLDRSAVSIIEVSKDELGSLNWNQLGKEASLPKLNIDLNDLRAALPVSPITKPGQKLWQSPIYREFNEATHKIRDTDFSEIVKGAEPTESNI